MNDAQRHGLVLDPLDVLFFRDGRPFGPSTRAGGTLPTPQTLWGALITALLTRHRADLSALAHVMKQQPDFAAAAASAAPDLRWLGELCLRGPWLARRNGHQPLEIFYPVPATLHRFKDDCANSAAPSSRGTARSPFPTEPPRPTPCVTLRPLPADRALPGWSASGPHSTNRPLWTRAGGATEPAKGFLDQDTMRAFLKGETIDAGTVLSGDCLFQSDERTGIEIDADRLTAAESKIYGARFLSLKPGIVFYAEAILPGDAPPNALDGLDVLAWGGEGRRVRVERLPPQPTGPTPRAGEKPMLVLTTPGLFDDGWRPKCLADALVAAAVPERLAVSGWDLARGGPKPNRFAAPAGSVYFLESLPNPQNLPDALSDRPLDRQQGWGYYLVGAWTDA